MAVLKVRPDGSTALVGRPKFRTLEDKKVYEREWLRNYRAKLRAQGKLKPKVHPEVTARRKSRAAKKAAQMIREGVYNVVTKPWARRTGVW